MRVGDVYKINRMLSEGHDDKAILKRFKNDYPEDEVKVFIKAGKDELKPEVKKASKKKSDPLG